MGVLPSLGVPPSAGDFSGQKCWEWSNRENKWVILQPPVEQTLCIDTGVRGSSNFREWSSTEPERNPVSTIVPDVRPGIPPTVSRDSNALKCWTWSFTDSKWKETPEIAGADCTNYPSNGSPQIYRQLSPTMPLIVPPGISR